MLASLLSRELSLVNKVRSGPLGLQIDSVRNSRLSSVVLRSVVAGSCCIDAYR